MCEILRITSLKTKDQPDFVNRPTNGGLHTTAGYEPADCHIYTQNSFDIINPKGLASGNRTGGQGQIIRKSYDEAAFKSITTQELAFASKSIFYSLLQDS